MIRPRRRAKRSPLGPCPLWSVPAEVRCIVWSHVVGSGPVILFGTRYSNGAPVSIERLASRLLLTEEFEQACDRHHKGRTQPKKRRLRLSWLRTCKQIYEEAKPVVFSNMTIHFCDPMVYSRFMEIVLEFTKKVIRSLEFGSKITIKPDGADGLLPTFSRTWKDSHRDPLFPYPCTCPFCFVTSPINLKQYLPSLRDLCLMIFFQCRLFGPRPTAASTMGRTRSGHSSQQSVPLRFNYFNGIEEVQKTAKRCADSSATTASILRIALSVFNCSQTIFTIPLLIQPMVVGARVGQLISSHLNRGG